MFLNRAIVMAALVLATLASLHAGPRVLFVRGGAGTGGFLEGGADEQLADISDYSTRGGNHGWGELADWLRENDFELEQRMEGPVHDNTPVPFADLDLSSINVIVLGSNNADYEARHVDAMENWVKAGGGLLVISDANFGRNWGDAPDSDQLFLDRFGWVMNQDQGTYALTLGSNDFLEENHPILEGVRSFDGEGVSPIMIPDERVPNVETTIIARAKGSTRINNRYGQGSSRQTTSRDGSLVIAEVGEGRVAGHFDRNTFFNRNGAGTDLHRLDNRTYALNLFRWLAFGGGGLEVTIDEPMTSVVLLASEKEATPFRATARLFGKTLSIFDPATYAWSLVEGPGTVAFSKETGPATSVTFSTAGIYHIQVRAEHRNRQVDQVIAVEVRTEPAGAGTLGVSHLAILPDEMTNTVEIRLLRIGETSLTVALESSLDLETWTPLESMSVVTSEAFLFNMAAPAQSTFWRASVTKSRNE